MANENQNVQNNYDTESFRKDFERRNMFDTALYERFNVKRGLRNSDGSGVIAGITNISNVHGYIMDEGEKRPVEGKLTLRGYDLQALVDRSQTLDRFGYEDMVFLLWSGELPTQEKAQNFQHHIDLARDLPHNFCAHNLITHASKNIMNMLERAVAMLYTYDTDAEVETPEHEIQAAISLLSKLPRVMVLSYYAKRAEFYKESFIMHRAIDGYSTAETILSMLRPDRQFTHEEAMMLDVMLQLHAEHGGGNNSTFTCRVLTSSGTDPYSAYVGAIGSLKGKKHGGANIRVLEQHADLMASVKDWHDDGQVADYLRRTLAKETFDKSGLIYGMGHAVYTLSDPRTLLCKKYARSLAQGTEYQERFELIERIEQLSKEVISEVKGDSKAMCANIDMYSGLVYHMLGIPDDLLTPLFACARMAGWSAHRFEELVTGKRIIRPAYKSIVKEREL